MIGNLFLNFKMCPFIDCTFTMDDSTSHECCVTIGLNSEDELNEKIEDNIEHIIRESKCIPIKDNEFVYDLSYNFEEIKLEDGEDDSNVEYDFRAKM